MRHWIVTIAGFRPAIVIVNYKLHYNMKGGIYDGHKGTKI